MCLRVSHDERVPRYACARPQLFRISALEIYHNGKQYALAADGWELRGFVGSWDEFERHLLWYGTEKDLARDVLRGRTPQVGLTAKLLKDSGERDLMGRIRSYTGKEGYEFGDLTKVTVAKVGEGVVEGIRSYTGKDECTLAHAHTHAHARIRVHRHRAC